MRKKFIVGAAVLALLMNSPQVSADDNIVIFGGEFDDETAQPAPKKIQEPQPLKDPTPIEPPAPPKHEVQPPSKPEIIEPPVTEPIKPPETVEPPAKIQPQVKPPIEEQPADVDRPFEQPTEISSGQATVSQHSNVNRPFNNQPPVNEPRQNFSAPRQNPPPQNLKTLKQRFIKLAVDDRYTYYLDKNSVQWRRMPYSSSEYIADVWIRLIERTPRELDGDLAAYGADNYSAEISLARDQGYQYAPEDLTVLRNQSYVLEHYYLRPQTKQIQFLCELEVFGRPQNTINERAYDYKNWENLVPGSVESVVYDATIKIIGKSKSTERGHMTFSDMLDEYLRISL